MSKERVTSAGEAYGLGPARYGLDEMIGVEKNGGSGARPRRCLEGGARLDFWSAHGDFATRGSA
jgi:hypothetical protein